MGTQPKPKFAPVNYPPDPNPKVPKLKLPAGSWDCHFHCHGPSQIWPYSEGRNYTPPCAPIEYWFNMAEVLGIERGTIVQTAVQGNDTGSLFDAVEKSGGRLKAIIRANPDLDKAAVKKYHAAGVRGIRLNLVGRLHGGYDEKFFQRSVAHAVDAGWVVTMHIDTDHLVKLADVIRKIPGNAVLDNFVMIDARPGHEEPTLSVLMDLIKEPNVWIKCAAAYRMLKKGATHAQMTAMAKKIHAASPDRSLWGSNWPHSDYFKPNQMPNDGDLVDYLAEYVPDPANLKKLMADNPKRLFDF